MRTNIVEGEDYSVMPALVVRVLARLRKRVAPDPPPKPAPEPEPPSD